MKRAKDAAFCLILAAVFACLVSGCGQNQPAPAPVPEDILKYTVYPDTEEAPSLTFYWGTSKETAVPATVTGISSRYGGWEGGGGGGTYKVGFEPATESEMTFSSVHEPVYTYERGTVVYAHGDEVSIRYGRKYIVKYLHLDDIQPAVVVGETIEKGVLIGYTETMGSGSFWEVEVSHIKSTSEIRAVPVTDYLDTASRAVFDEILTKVGQSSWMHGTGEPTSESWLSYVGIYEFWSDAAKSGIADSYVSGFDSPEDFCTSHGMAWILN